LCDGQVPSEGFHKVRAPHTFAVTFGLEPHVFVNEMYRNSNNSARSYLVTSTLLTQTINVPMAGGTPAVSSIAKSDSFETENPPVIPPDKSPPTSSEQKNEVEEDPQGKKRGRPPEPRNPWIVAQHKEGLSPNGIREKWNRMTDEQRFEATGTDKYNGQDGKIKNKSNLITAAINRDKMKQGQ
jgi:hypothetical protein